MDQSEQSWQQQNIADGAGQMVNTPPPLHDAPDVVATSSNVPVSSTMQPPPPVSKSQHQLAYEQAQAQHLEHVRERLRQFWAKQMQEVTQADLKNHSLPLTPIKRIMKADKDVKMVAKESPALLSKACEMFILDLISRAWINTEDDGRRTVQNKDIAAAVYKTDIFDFLEDVIPRNELKEQILKARNAMQQVGSSAEPSMEWEHGVGASSTGTPHYAVGQQSPPFMPLYQPPPENQQSFMVRPQAQPQPGQQNQQQPFMPWPQAEQQNPEQPTLSSPQAHQQPDQQNQQQNDN